MHNDWHVWYSIGRVDFCVQIKNSRLGLEAILERGDIATELYD